MADPGGFLGFRGTPPFVVLRACVAGLVCAHERSRKRSGERNPSFIILDPPLQVLKRALTVFDIPNHRVATSYSDTPQEGTFRLQSELHGSSGSWPGQGSQYSSPVESASLPAHQTTKTVTILTPVVYKVAIRIMLRVNPAVIAQ